MEEGTVFIVGAPIVLLAAIARQAVHQADRSTLRGFRIRGLLRGAIEFGRRGQSAIIVDDVLLSVIGEFQVVRVQIDENIFGSLEISSAVEFSTGSGARCQCERRYRKSAAIAESDVKDSLVWLRHG